MEYERVSLEEAIKIQEGKRKYTMLQARGAIRTFFDVLGFPNKEIFMPRGHTLGTWLDCLALTYHEKTKASSVLDLLSQ